jgi:hypothetical protein
LLVLSGKMVNSSTKVWRYHRRNNQNTSIEEEQTIVYKTLHKILKIEQHQPHNKTWWTRVFQKSRQASSSPSPHKHVTCYSCDITTYSSLSIEQKYYYPFNRVFLQRKCKILSLRKKNIIVIVVYCLLYINEKQHASF